MGVNYNKAFYVVIVGLIDGLVANLLYILTSNTIVVACKWIIIKVGFDITVLKS